MVQSEKIKEYLFGSKLNKTQGLLEKANGGTILFNEIGDLTIDIQELILKFLKNNTFKISDADDLIKVDVRIICTTSKNLEKKLENGSFITDLYNRLKVIKINIPPLNKRPEDIKPLCDYFMKISQFYQLQLY